MRNIPIATGFAAKSVESLVKTLNMGNLYLKQFSYLLKKKKFERKRLGGFCTVNTKL